MASPNLQPWAPNPLAPAQQIGSQNPTYNNGDASGVMVRPMRLKVLYTFDDQNKTNCLARWPQVLHIQTVQIEDNATIGVIQLKICIQAIVQCSPELVAKLGQDYTVYAYDYSEYDNPLVGQGMLSWALSSASPTPEAPCGRQLITGRVCRNIQGLFSNGVAETLEVKLRLVPVPTVLQSEYISSMEKYREMSKAMPPGFDHNEWFAFLQANPYLSQQNSRVNTPVPTGISVSQRQGTSMEIVNQLLSPNLQPQNGKSQNSVDPFNNPYQLEKPGSNSRPESPAGINPAKPASRPSSRTSVKRPRKPRAPAKAKMQNQGGNTSGYEEGTDGDDMPMAKKRATVSKTNWNSKSSFGTASDSLRVAASTSGSLRLFRPIAMAPGNAPLGAGSHLQETARAPTPVPQLPPLPRSKQAAGQSTMRRNSILSKATLPQLKYNSPYPPSESGYQSQSELHPSIESAMTSPEKEDSPADTPPDITSSPPRLIGSQSARSTPACPSSPVLPPMPRTGMTDSGFMSGEFSELFEEQSPRPPTEEGASIAARNHNNRRRNAQPPYNPPPIHPPNHHGFRIQEVTPGPPELLPSRMLPRPEPKPVPKQKPQRKAIARTNSTVSESGLPSAPAMQRQNSMQQQSHPLSRIRSIPPAEIPPNMDPAMFEQQPAFSPPELPMPMLMLTPTPVPPPVPRQEAPLPPSRPASRPASRAVSRAESVGELPVPAVPASEPAGPRPSTLQHANTWSEAPHARTDAPPGREDSEQPNGKPVNVAYKGKKNGIQSRLEAAIAKGEMPPFCTNCGAISTPTWRKAWAIECAGDPGYHEYSDQPGMTTAIDILAKDEKGRPTSYRLIKKSLLPSEDKTVFTEILLCNPCGIWMSKYKSQRPEDRWLKDRMDEPDGPSGVTKGRKKRATSGRPRKGQTAAPTSEANFFSDAPGPMDRDESQAPGSFNAQVSIAVTEQQAHVYHKQANNERSESLQAPRNSGHKRAEAALRRAVQSSPAREIGTCHSPIELEDEMDATRRLLFPSPRKDGTPKVLGEVAVNSAVSPTDFHSPSKGSTRSAFAKENHPAPAVEDEDLIRLFEEGLPRPERPSTPGPKNTDGPSPFKTPTRPTPSHRPITRSVTRSAQRSIRSIRSLRIAGEMLPQRTPTKSPSTVRRSPRHRNLIESPFTATMNRLLSEGNNGQQFPSRNLDLNMIDFGNLPDLNGDLHSDVMGFGHGHDGYEHHQDQFFSTDMPMPSSPPRGGFHDIYSDPLNMSVEQLEAMDQALWDELARTDQGQGMEGLGGGLVIDASGRASFMGGTAEVAIKVEEEDSQQMVTEKA